MYKYILQLRNSTKRLLISGLATVIALITLHATAAALTTTSSATTGLLTTIINAGNGEISRRLTTLNNLTSVINSAQYLTASDKSSLSSEVTTEVSDLTSLKTKLDAETTISAATADDTAVITEYRVYLLVVPQVYIVISADNQQSVEAALSKAATGFQSAITTAQNAGKNVTTLQSELSSLNSQVTAAQAISSNMETTVVGITPTTFNGNETILTGDYNKLLTAQTDNEAAINDANQLLTGLQALI